MPLDTHGQASSQRPQRTQASSESSCWGANSATSPTPRISVSSMSSIFSRVPVLRWGLKMMLSGMKTRWRSLVKGMLARNSRPRAA